MMQDPIKKFFGSSQIGICLKNKRGKVLFQNGISQDLCGNRLAAKCGDDGVCLPFKPGALTHHCETVQFHKDCLCNGRYFDVVFMHNQNEIAALFYPLTDTHAWKVSYFKNKNLSKREFEIVNLIIHGRSNREIIHSLKISRPTLRTHLSKIYKKISSQDAQLLRNVPSTSG